MTSRPGFDSGELGEPPPDSGVRPPSRVGEVSCHLRRNPSRRNSIPRPAATLSLALAAILLCVGNGLATLPVVATSPLRIAPAPATLSPAPRLGALVPLTGGLSAYGPGMANAVQMVGEQVNASGGIRGTDLSIYVEDSQTDPNAAKAAASDLIQAKGVQAIVGDATTSGTLAAFQGAQPAGIVMMFPRSSSPVRTHDE